MRNRYFEWKSQMKVAEIISKILTVLRARQTCTLKFAFN